jgi:uncharacterized protein (TIGR01777 family)
MRVIITGGTGLIGRPLAARLASDGHEVIVLSRHPSSVGGIPPNVRVAGWDARTAGGWGPLADGAGAIINLAGENIGEGRWTEDRKQSILQSRLHAGQAVVEAVQAATTKPGVVIQSSAVGYYGPRGDEELTEDAPAGNDFTSHVAVQWEASTAPVEAMGVRRVVIRSGVVLAREGGALPRMALPFRLFAGGYYGNGRQWLSWIHSADEVRGIQFLMENSAASGVFNLTSPQPLTSRAFAQALARAMGRPDWIPVPAVAFQLLFGEMSTMLLDGQRVIPRHLLDLGFRFDYPDATQALRNLLQ